MASGIEKLREMVEEDLFIKYGPFSRRACPYFEGVECHDSEQTGDGRPPRTFTATGLSNKVANIILFGIPKLPREEQHRWVEMVYETLDRIPDEWFEKIGSPRFIYTTNLKNPELVDFTIKFGLNRTRIRGGPVRMFEDNYDELIVFARQFLAVFAEAFEHRTAQDIIPEKMDIC